MTEQMNAMRLELNLIKVPVSDITRSVAFYETALDLTAEFSSAEYGWAQMGGASFSLALYVPNKGGGDRLPGGSVDFHLSHDDLASLHQQVARVASDAAIHANDDGTRSLEFSDPDGNLLKVMERSLDPE